jgi:hypothetical protein
MTNFKKHMLISVTQAHIDAAKCRDPNKCMIKLAVIDAVGKRCYCKVDLRGISITRRNDYRERSFIPQNAGRALVRFDSREEVRPFHFWCHFEKTTRIVSEERKAQVVQKRKEAKANGIKPKRYAYAKRIAGLAVEGARA